MNPTIRMGNDEFIHYIRKNYPNRDLYNPNLGLVIAQWIETNDLTRIQHEPEEDCLWPRNQTIPPGFGLPDTAHQFTFRRDLLPRLYSYLDELGANAPLRVIDP